MTQDQLALFYIIAIIVGIILGVIFYFIPSFIAYSRKHESKGWVLFLNFILGWTVLGWFFVLFWAAFGQKQRDSISHSGESDPRNTDYSHYTNDGNQEVNLSNGIDSNKIQEIRRRMSEN